MRPIKFRGKDAFQSKYFPAKWREGGLMMDGEDAWLYVLTDDKGIVSVKVQSDTVGQFTGLLDKNGKEIYEGDIITVNGNYPRVVIWDKMTWGLMPTEFYHDKYFWVMNLQHPGTDWWDEFADEFEVIGNIFDNPEMLKVGGAE